MSLSEIAQITITTETAGILQTGFGVPMVLSPRPTWTERVREYDSLTDMVTDGFTSSTPEYKAASAIFSQSPRPPTLLVGRCANKPTQKFTITPTAANSTVYSLKVNGTLVSITSDGSATATEICDALRTAIDLLAVSGLTTSGTATLIMTMTIGLFVSVEITNTALLTILQDHADPGLAADLAAIALENNDWYGFVHLYNSKACIEACATYSEANKKTFCAQSQDSAIENTAISGTDDVAESLKSSAYARTEGIYHRKTDAFADAAWLGKCLPFAPGSETWKFKTLAGVPAVTMTATQRTNIRAKNFNMYYTVAGRNITSEGKTASGEFIDVIRGRDWLEARLGERIFSRLANAKKIPFTDAGIAIIEAEIRAQLAEGIAVGLLSNDPAPTVTVPKASAVSTVNKAARTLPDVKFDAVLAGAIHVVQISGTVAV